MPHAAEWDLSQTGTETVFFLGPSALENGFIQEAVKLAWKPIVLVPGYVAGKQIFDAPSAFEGRILVAYPTLILFSDCASQFNACCFRTRACGCRTMP
jgi:hypothetical protein